MASYYYVPAEGKRKAYVMDEAGLLLTHSGTFRQQWGAYDKGILSPTSVRGAFSFLSRSNSWCFDQDKVIEVGTGVVYSDRFPPGKVLRARCDITEQRVPKPQVVAPTPISPKKTACKY